MNFKKKKIFFLSQSPFGQKSIILGSRLVGSTIVGGGRGKCNGISIEKSCQKPFDFGLALNTKEK